MTIAAMSTGPVCSTYCQMADPQGERDAHVDAASSRASVGRRAEIRAPAGSADGDDEQHEPEVPGDGADDHDDARRGCRRALLATSPTREAHHRHEPRQTRR